MTGKTKDIPRLTHCPQCEYDLAGLPEKHACPECGYAYSKDAIVVRGWERGKTPGILRILVWGLLIVFINPFNRLSLANLDLADFLLCGLLMLYGFWLIRDVFLYVKYLRNRTAITVLFSPAGFEKFIGNASQSSQTWSSHHQIELHTRDLFWLGLRIFDAGKKTPPRAPLDIMFDGKQADGKLIRKQLEAYIAKAGSSSDE